MISTSACNPICKNDTHLVGGEWRPFPNGRVTAFTIGEDFVIIDMTPEDIRRERNRIAGRKYRLRNAEKERERKRKQLADPEYREGRRVYGAKWQKANPDKTKAYQKKYSSKPESKIKKALQMRRWRAKNPERSRQQCRESHARNPNPKRAGRWKRKALLKGATVNPEAIAEFIAKMRGRRFVKCYYCKSRVSGKTAHLEHIVPISKGGAHSIENICSSCPPCNLRKGNKDISVMEFGNQRILPL